MSNNYTMRLLLTILLFISHQVYAKTTPVLTDMVVTKDTTINDTLIFTPGKILRFLSGGHIHGNAVIYNATIDASLHQWIFDTTVTLNLCKSYGTDFSFAWYGVLPINSDNSAGLQKTANTVIKNYETMSVLYLPKGIHRFSRELKLQDFYDNKYWGTTLRIHGEGSMFNGGYGSKLLYTSFTGNAISGQMLKGAEIDHLTIEGQFQPPVFINDRLWFAQTMEQFRDKRCSPLYAGICIDPDGSKNTGGSTGVKIHDCNISNFTYGILISPNLTTYNADVILIEDVNLWSLLVGVAGSQAQEKYNVLENVVCWGGTHTMYTFGMTGKKQNGNWTILKGGTAGGVIRYIYTNQQDWNTISISKAFCEDLGSFGNITSDLPCHISDCTFDFKDPATAGYRTLISTSWESTKIHFDNCSFRYNNGRRDTLFVYGVCTFDRCTGGPIVKTNNRILY